MRQEDEADGPQDTGKAQEPEGSAEKAGSKKDKYQKAQAKAEHTGEKLGKAREKLDKTEAKRAAKKPPGLAKKAVRGARTDRARTGGRLPLLFHPAARGHRNLPEAAG